MALLDVVWTIGADVVLSVEGAVFVSAFSMQPVNIKKQPVKIIRYFFIVRVVKFQV